jgi:carbamoyltransferase
MLLQHYIPEKHRNGIEGIVHADGTSRIQVLFSRDDHSFIYDLLDYLDRQFDIKALINTSFNVQGEPMVHTAEDAINSAKSMKLGALILNDRLMIF